MKNKGFTLIELLAAILIISILGAIGIVSYRNVFKTAEDRYYDTIESNMLLAGNDYFEDHRNEVPIGSEYSEVSLSDLVVSKYMDEVKDVEGNVCSNGAVFAYRENNKLKYEACLKCGNYESSGRFCNTISSRLINVRGKKVGSTEYDYDVLKSYNKQGYSDGKNIIINVSMNEEYNATRYIAVSTKNSNIQKECSVGNNNSCDMEIEETGIYRVIAYDSDNKEISSRYINVKIAKGGPNFELEGETEYLISKNECSNGTTTKNVSVTIVPGTQEEYKKIEYQINGGEIEESVGLNLSLSLESGHYDIDVYISNYSNEVSTRRISIDISYLVDIQYTDGGTATHQVVKGQNYNYLSELPLTRNDNTIRWYVNGTQINPTDIITNNCTFTLEGRTEAVYTIDYILNNGTVATDNPTSYLERSETITLNNPTRSGYTFLGWVVDNDINTGASEYTTTSPFVANTRDHAIGNEFSVTPGTTYRVILTAKRVEGNILIKGGLWYTEKTSGNAWDGVEGEFILAEELSGGYARYYKDVTVPAGKSKAKAYIEIEQWSNTCSWNIADIHVIIPSNAATIPHGSTGNKTYEAAWTRDSISYNENIFAARSQTTNGLTIEYIENGSYLVLNGTPDATTIATLWNLERRSFSANDEYRITIKHVSGSLKCTDSDNCKGTNGRPYFVLDLTTNGSRFSDRRTPPASRVNVIFPTAGVTINSYFVVDSSRTSANGLQFWIWQDLAGNATFTDYKVQILVTKLDKKYITTGSQYGTLKTPTKTGYTFNGWYTEPTGGTKVNTTDTFSSVNQTLYAQWTSNKLSVRYNGGASNATWCSTSTSYSMDSSKFAVATSTSNRDVQIVPYGQFVNEASGFNNYNNTSWFCFESVGNTVTTGAEWVLSNDSSKTYDHADKTITSDTLATDAGCNLGTTANCTAQINVNWKPLVYSVTLNNQSATSGGTTKVYYQYKTTKTVNGTKCYYFTDPELTNCLSSGYIISTPTKTGYTFGGYYTATNGEGTNYVNSSGTFINSIYNKKPSEINSSYTTDITLYAKWIPNTYSVTLNNQSATSAGTTKVYYQYKTTKSINGTTCYYYTDSALTTCLSSGYVITNPAKTGYTFGGYYTATGGSGTNYVNTSGSFTNSIYQKLPSEINSSYTTDITLYAKWTANNYTLTYSDNLFAARSQSTNGVVATYTENGSYITLNGTLNTTSIGELWNLERRTINSGDQYKVTLNYVSGSLTCADKSDCTGSAGRPVFVIDLTTDGSSFSDRTTSPISYMTLSLPTSGSNSGTLTVDSSRASSNGLRYWIWQKTASNAVFNNYKVQIIITKVHSKSVTYNAQYGTLDTPTKTGYDFNGWYTAASGGTKITNTSTYTTAGNQTLYAQWTSHKLKLSYNGNGSDVTWCSNHATYSMDSNKYAMSSSTDRYYQTVGYGQFISYGSGLNNYDNDTCFCFARTGYGVTTGAEWILNGKTNTYDHNDTSVTAIDIASASGCNLQTTSTCNAQVNVNWKAKNYTLTYSDNLFAARTQSTNGVVATYDENNSYLTLNGTLTTTSIDELWNLEKRSFATNDKYKITIKYVSGSLTCADKSDCTGSAGRPHFVFDMTKDGTTFSDRGTSPISFIDINFPTSGTEEQTFTVSSNRTSGNGLKYWIWQKTANNAKFNNYRVQIIITKVHSKSITYNAQYGTLDTPTKTGYDFNGWYTAVSGGTKITNTTTNSTANNQTLYAQWTSHKLIIQYNGNGNDVTWCSTNTSYSMDSEKYEIKSSSRNAQYIPYGQFVSYGSGLDNYDNASYTCFSKSGKKAVAGAEWILNGKSNTYGHNDTTVNAIAIASAAGCNLQTTSSCTARMNVNWAGDATITCTNPTYTGNSLTIATCSGGTLSNHTRTAAGSQTVTCTGDGSHSTATKSCSVAKAAATLSCSTKTYNGSSQTGCTCSGGTIGGTYSATNAGSYTASCSADSNHTSPNNVTWTINKAVPYLGITEQSASFEVGATKTYGVIPGVNGHFDYASNNTGVAGVARISDDTTCKTANSQCVFKLTGVSAGTATIHHVYTPDDTANYTTASVTFTATVTAPAVRYRWNASCDCIGNGTDHQGSYSYTIYGNSSWTSSDDATTNCNNNKVSSCRTKCSNNGGSYDDVGSCYVYTA